jgi:hypothetical protein
VQLQRIESDKHAETIDRALRVLDRLFGRTHGLTLEIAFSTVETTMRMVRTADESTDFDLAELAEMRSSLLHSESSGVGQADALIEAVVRCHLRSLAPVGSVSFYGRPPCGDGLA